MLSQQHAQTEPRSAIAFLQSVIALLQESKEPPVALAAPILYLRMQIASLHLRAGDERKCKELVEAGQAQLAAMEDVDASVHAAVHHVASGLTPSHT